MCIQTAVNEHKCTQTTTQDVGSAGLLFLSCAGFSYTGCKRFDKSHKSVIKMPFTLTAKIKFDHIVGFIRWTVLNSLEFGDLGSSLKVKVIEEN